MMEHGTVDSPTDVASAEEASAWPALVDLLSATSLLFLTFLCVMIYVAVRERGRTEELATTRERLLTRLNAASARGTLFRVDSTEKQFVRIVLNAGATFSTQGAWQWRALRDSGQIALDRIALVLNERALQRLYREVRVVGYTDQDPYPGSTETFSNWELSAARAAVVARFLVNRAGVDPCAISATGYGPYFPVIPKARGQQKEANRRIEIEIVPRLAAVTSAPARACDPLGDGSRARERAAGS